VSYTCVFVPPGGILPRKRLAIGSFVVRLPLFCSTIPTMNRTSVVRSFAAFIAGCLLATPAVAFEEMICRDCGRDHWAERAAMAEGHQGGSGRQYAPDRVVDVLHIKIDVTPD